MLADFLARTVEFEKLARPQQFDAFDRRFGSVTKPFQTLLAAACGSSFGVPSSPEASNARSSEANTIDQPLFGSDDRAT